MTAIVCSAERQRKPSLLGFFRHHGVWAVGVRLFRSVGFPTKAALISCAFLVPLTLLLGFYLRDVWASMDFTARERAGVALLRHLEPWLVEVQKQRRMVLGGDARVNVAAIDDKIAPVREAVSRRPEGVDLTAQLGDLLKHHEVLLEAVRQGGDTGTALQAYVDAILTLRDRTLDASQLSLDPEQATYYLMSMSTTELAEVVESVSRSQGMAGAAGTDPTAQQLRELYAVWHRGKWHLQRMADQFGRAVEAEPSLREQVPLLDAIQAAEAFHVVSEGFWFGREFQPSVQALEASGQVTVDALRKVGTAGLDELDRLLAERNDHSRRNMVLTLVLVALALAVVAYLFRSFYLVMRGGLGEVERHLRSLTAGDLTTSPRPWGRDEAARLMLTLADMQRSLRDIVTEVRSASDGLVHASDEIAGASQDLSRRSESAAASLEQSAATMQQISQTARDTAEVTHNATRLAGDNAGVAEASGRAIGQVIATMQDVQTASQRISSIIGVIDGIAFQTNILALNAAVEAARAGEQGRGFAVVAGEVRALAQRSATAAKEISALIRQSVGRVDGGNRDVGHAGEQLRQLMASAERMKALMAEVLRGASEQTAGVQQVEQALQLLDQQTQQNAALVEQTAAASGSLRDQALGLASSVSRFKLATA
jgi:methyl-accepting chemotaxis protein